MLPVALENDPAEPVREWSLATILQRPARHRTLPFGGASSTAQDRPPCRGKSTRPTSPGIRSAVTTASENTRPRGCRLCPSARLAAPTAAFNGGGDVRRRRTWCPAAPRVNHDGALRPCHQCGQVTFRTWIKSRDPAPASIARRATDSFPFARYIPAALEQDHSQPMRWNEPRRRRVTCTDLGMKAQGQITSVDKCEPCARGRHYRTNDLLKNRVDALLVQAHAKIRELAHGGYTDELYTPASSSGVGVVLDAECRTHERSGSPIAEPFEKRVSEGERRAYAIAANVDCDRDANTNIAGLRHCCTDITTVKRGVGESASEVEGDWDLVGAVVAVADVDSFAVADVPVFARPVSVHRIALRSLMLQLREIACPSQLPRHRSNQRFQIPAKITELTPATTTAQSHQRWQRRQKSRERRDRAGYRRCWSLWPSPPRLRQVCPSRHRMRCQRWLSPPHLPASYGISAVVSSRSRALRRAAMSNWVGIRSHWT
jgi:hypothetical protein